MAGARCLAVLCALCMLPVASAAGAPKQGSRHIEVQPPTGSALIQLPERGGYDLGISAPNDRVLLVYVEKIVESRSMQKITEPPPVQTVVNTVYAVHAHNDLANGLVRARVGDLGRVAFRFKPAGRPRLGHNPKTCQGRAPVSESGVFRGTVSLDGEGHYFHVNVSSAEGELHRSFRLKCAQGHAEKTSVAPLRHYVEPNFGFEFGSNGGSIALLYAAAKTQQRYVGIRVAHYEGEGPGAEVAVETLEPGPGVMIERGAFVNGEAPGEFLTSLPGIHPASAKLAPPAPFHGEAEYLENSSTSHSWTGSLGVAFPGLDLPLAGSDFASSLCVLSPLKTPSGCDFAKPHPLRYARIGGSG